jgi:hypothetical protein
VDEAVETGLRPEQVQISQDYGGGFPANVEGLHHLHCLVRVCCRSHVGKVLANRGTESPAQKPALELRLLPRKEGRRICEQRIHCASPHDSLSRHVETGTDVQP